MADPNPNPQTKPHFPISKLNSRIQQKPIKQGKSCSDFLFKILFLALFIVVVPLFPSQAPDFLNQTILTKLWELLHLLFIGIAVAYGLFSRRNVELETHVETQSSDDNNNTPSYVSKMFPASNIFGDVSENQNLYGFDEKKMMHYWNPERETGVDCSNRGTATVGVFDEQCNTQFPVYDDSFDYSVRFDGNGTNNVTNVVQAWNSEYYHSEPVVVAQPYYGSGECGEVVGHKPLGLPVRSLKLVAREVDGDGPKFANEIESDSSSGSRGLDESKDREFGDVGPSSLEKLFNDADAGGGSAGSASPIPWNLRGRRMEREKRYGNVTGPSHFRPLSVDETKFEALGSRSIQSATSYSSHTSMYSSFDSISSDNMDFQVEEMRQKEASYMPASENMNFQEKEMGRRKTSYVAAPENMIFQEEDIQQRKTTYVSASDNMNSQENETGRRKTSYVPAPENMIFQEEDIEQRKTNAYVPASGNTSFRKRDLGKKISKGLSLRRMRNKGKYADVSHPSHLRPMSVDETQSESLNLESFQSAGRFSSHSHKRMYSSLDSTSSDNVDFQEEDMGQEKTSENISFQEEEDMEHKKTSYVFDSENVNFQEEELGQETSYVPASEDMNFQEVDLLQKTSQVSSRNGMMENRGNYAAESQSSDFRPISVDETQHESLSSRSFQSMRSFSSQTSLRSRSSVDSVSSEYTNSLQEGLGEKKSLHGSSSSSSSSPSPSTRRNSETSLQPFQDDLKNDLNDDWRGISGIGGEDSRGSVNKESGMHALQSSDSDKAASLPKTPSRGKSVRTRRASGLNSGTMKIGETSSREADEKVAKKSNNVDTVMRKDKMKDLLIKGIGKKSLDSICPKPEVSFSNRRRRDKLEPSNSVSKESSDEDVVSEHVNDSGLDSEVDKKASEFIAKFKAQIRLQKMDSFDRSKGQKIFGKIIR